MKLSKIAVLVGGTVEGDPEAEIERLAKIEDAGPGEVTFLANLKYSKHLVSTGATAILIGRDVQPAEIARRKSPINLLRVDDPYASFAKLIDVFHPPATSLPVGIHPTAVVPTSASLGRSAAIGAHVVLGERCVVGDNTSIWHGCVLGDDAHVGAACILYPNVVVREQCVIGDRVIIQPGAVIGGDGFGFAPLPDGTYSKIPQRGRVIIEDDVEIGANTTIDRATIGETRIKKGTKLDNLIQVAHNCVVGENTMMAAQAGVSGSTKLGKGCMIGGQVGFAGHLQIADKTSVGAQSGVHRSVIEPGRTIFGSPALDHKERFRIEGALRRLPELLSTVRDLQNRLDELAQAFEKAMRSAGETKKDS
jgi:UDP-3-O-[3-hydroxymyristoyl] glucosamine N-acyltransferase